MVRSLSPFSSSLATWPSPEAAGSLAQGSSAPTAATPVDGAGVGGLPFARPTPAPRSSTMPTVPGQRRRSSVGPHFGHTIAGKVRAALAKAEPADLTPAERHVIDRGYCLERHLRAFKVAAGAGSFSFSIRYPGGRDTAACQDDGAPAKPGEIKEKTVKESTLVAAYGPQAGRALLDELRRVGADRGHPLAGRVGHWSDDGKRLLGFYMSPDIEGWDGSSDPARRALFEATRPVPSRPGRVGRVGRTGAASRPRHRYFPIDLANLGASLQSLCRVPEWNTLVFGGDIDLHDLRHLRHQIVAQGSPDESRLRDLLQSAIGGADDYRAPDSGKPHMVLLPHGAQQNYGAFVLNNPSAGEPNLDLTRIDLPVAAFLYRRGAVEVREIADMPAYLEAFPRNLNAGAFVAGSEGVRFDRRASVASDATPASTDAPRRRSVASSFASTGSPPSTPFAWQGAFGAAGPAEPASPLARPSSSRRGSATNRGPSRIPMPSPRLSLTPGSSPGPTSPGAVFEPRPAPVERNQVTTRRAAEAWSRVRSRLPTLSMGRASTVRRGEPVGEAAADRSPSRWTRLRTIVSSANQSDRTATLSSDGDAADDLRPGLPARPARGGGSA